MIKIVVEADNGFKKEVYLNEGNYKLYSTFAKYKKCRDVYVRLWQQGRSVLQLTVAA